MTTLITGPAASALLALDVTGGATLTQIARATGRSTSTIQRAIDGLIAAHVVVRDAPRGPVSLAPGAPVRALLELAEWCLGPETAREIRSTAHAGREGPGAWVPATIRNPTIRAALPGAIQAIVAAVDPARVLLFGSQARGDARPDSDVDLLVVFDRPVDKREVRNEVGRALATMPFGKDILVAETADLERPMPGTALVGAVRDGVVIHER